MLSARFSGPFRRRVPKCHHANAIYTLSNEAPPRTIPQKVNRLRSSLGSTPTIRYGLLSSGRTPCTVSEALVGLGIQRHAHFHHHCCCGLHSRVRLLQIVRGSACPLTFPKELNIMINHVTFHTYTDLYLSTVRREQYLSNLNFHFFNSQTPT